MSHSRTNSLDSCFVPPPGLALLIAFEVKIPGTVGRVDLIDEVDPAIPPSKLVFGIDQDQTLCSSHFSPPLEEGPGVFFQHFIISLADDPPGKDILAGDVFIVPFLGFGSRRDDGLRKAIVFFHPFGKWDAAEFALARLISAPGMAGQVGADDHFEPDGFAVQPHRRVGIGYGLQPVGADILGSPEEVSSQLIEHLTFIGNWFGKNVIECRDPVGCDGDQTVAYKIDVAHLAAIKGRLARQAKMRFGKSLCGSHNASVAISVQR